MDNNNTSISTSTISELEKQIKESSTELESILKRINQVSDDLTILNKMKYVTIDRMRKSRNEIENRLKNHLTNNMEFKVGDIIEINKHSTYNFIFTSDNHELTIIKVNKKSVVVTLKGVAYTDSVRKISDGVVSFNITKIKLIEVMSDSCDTIKDILIRDENLEQLLN